MKRILLMVLVLVGMTVWVAESPGQWPEKGKKTIVLPPENTTLKPGPGLEKVEANCLVCHSGDYIQMQPSFTRAQWAAEVTKMIKVMGARVADADAPIIVDYLVKNYGKEK